MLVSAPSAAGGITAIPAAPQACARTRRPAAERGTAIGTTRSVSDAQTQATHHHGRSETCPDTD